MKHVGLVGFLSIGLLVTGCSGDSGGGGTDTGVFGVEGWATLRSQVPGSNVTYTSGYDGGANQYQVPMGFVGEGVTMADFTVADPSIAEIRLLLPVDSPLVPDGVTLTAVLVESVGVGTTTITGMHNGTAYTANYTVNSYTAADVTLGTERYNGPVENGNDDLRRACSTCHDALQAHSTAFLADLSDAEILRTAVEGVSINFRDPATGEVREYMPNNGMHMWDVTEAEKVGITAYLRSRDATYQLPK